MTKKKQPEEADRIDSPRNWDEKLWHRVWTIAKQMNRQELVAFWLASLAGHISDSDFIQALEDMKRFSKDDVLGILDEINRDDALHLIKEYGERRAENKWEVDSDGMARKQSA